MKNDKTIHPPSPALERHKRNTVKLSDLVNNHINTTYVVICICIYIDKFYN